MPSLPFKISGQSTRGWLVLIGGGEFSLGETEEIDRFILEKMPRENRAVAFLPTASGSQEYARQFGDYLQRLDRSVTVTNVPVYRGRDVRRSRNIELVRNAGLIYLGGGAANSLLPLIGSPIAEAMLDALDRGAVIAAMGAAATIFGVAALAGSAGEIVDAMNLVRSVAIHAPFDPARELPIRVLLGNSQAEMVLAIPAATALAISPEREGLVVGPGSVGVFRPQMSA